MPKHTDFAVDSLVTQLSWQLLNCFRPVALRPWLSSSLLLAKNSPYFLYRYYLKKLKLFLNYFNDITRVISLVQIL